MWYIHTGVIYAIWQVVEIVMYADWQIVGMMIFLDIMIYISSYGYIVSHDIILIYGHTCAYIYIYNRINNFYKYSDLPCSFTSNHCHGQCMDICNYTICLYMIYLGVDIALRAGTHLFNCFTQSPWHVFRSF